MICVCCMTALANALAYTLENVSVSKAMYRFMQTTPARAKYVPTRACAINRCTATRPSQLMFPTSVIWKKKIVMARKWKIFILRFRLVRKSVNSKKVLVLNPVALFPQFGYRSNYYIDITRGGLASWAIRANACKTGYMK